MTEGVASGTPCVSMGSHYSSEALTQLCSRKQGGAHLQLLEGPASGSQSCTRRGVGQQPFPSGLLLCQGGSVGHGETPGPLLFSGGPSPQRHCRTLGHSFPGSRKAVRPRWLGCPPSVVWEGGEPSRRQPRPLLRGAQWDRQLAPGARKVNPGSSSRAGRARVPTSAPVQPPHLHGDVGREDQQAECLDALGQAAGRLPGGRAVAHVRGAGE